MDQIFHYHYEHKKLSPLLAERAVKLFLHNFDPEKTYLLHAEAHPPLRMTKKQKEKIVEGFYKGDFSYFDELRESLADAVRRAHRQRVRPRAVAVGDHRDGIAAHSGDRSVELGGVDERAVAR